MRKASSLRLPLICNSSASPSSVCQTNSGWLNCYAYFIFTAFFAAFIGLYFFADTATTL